MTQFIREKPRQAVEISFNDPKSVREYAVFGTNVDINMDRGAVVDLILATVPSVDAIDSMTAGTIYLYIEKYGFKENPGGGWDVSVYYGKTPNYVEVTIDTTGGTNKLLQSLNTVMVYGAVAGEGPPEFNGAIGVNGNNVEGVDVPIPKFQLNVNKKLTMSTMSGAYVALMYQLTGRTNDAPYTIVWKGQTLNFDTHELLFRGFRSKETSTDNLDVNYIFEASPALTEDDGQMIGDAGPIVKDGWDYLWVNYRVGNDPTAFALTREPVGVYIEQVLKDADFTLIGL